MSAVYRQVEPELFLACGGVCGSEGQAAVTGGQGPVSSVADLLPPFDWRILSSIARWQIGN